MLKIWTIGHISRARLESSARTTLRPRSVGNTPKGVDIIGVAAADDSGIRFRPPRRTGGRAARILQHCGCKSDYDLSLKCPPVFGKFVTTTVAYSSGSAN